MAFDASLAKLQAEASCPLCLDHLRDPVTIDCGHNFCSSCIHQRWEGLRGTFPCPVCLHHCPDRSLKRNPQICHMTEIVQQISTSGSQRKLQEEIPLCGKHNEALTLFCEENMELLCSRCRVSSDHQDQHLIPIEEAAASHRWVLKEYMADFTNHLENIEKVYKVQFENTPLVRIREWRDKLYNEFRELKSFLEIEKSELDNALLTEENDVEGKLVKNRRQISYHMFRLNTLLTEIEEKCLQTDRVLLTGIERIHNSYGNLETPAVFSYELKEVIFTLPPHYVGLHKMTRTFQVDLTLDPETAHPSLFISSDRKSVTYRGLDGHSNPQTLSYADVLSSEGFDAGRHFWMVNIEGRGLYYLGLCKASFPRNTLISASPSNGCWQHQLWNHTEERKIGIFLDYELGEVSFYNLNNRSYMYVITDTFTEKLMPCFSIALASESLTISIIRVK
ncbi:tripartite motif-containing protein 60-like [Pipistrellus kuhlii]|uniref:tripartite motif-containing protein 60-like n=1 Tax=Pipistrellus kuhlii TaxID=59472 RepID=UPI00174F1C7D|nr:tripartite motif-containing protein 60-like [Pipistrellus kuhlii]